MDFRSKVHSFAELYLRPWNRFLSLKSRAPGSSQISASKMQYNCSLASLAELFADQLILMASLVSCSLRNCYAICHCIWLNLHCDASNILFCSLINWYCFHNCSVFQSNLDQVVPFEGQKHLPLHMVK